MTSPITPKITRSGKKKCSTSVRVIPVVDRLSGWVWQVIVGPHNFASSSAHQAPQPRCKAPALPCPACAYACAIAIDHHH